MRKETFSRLIKEYLKDNTVDKLPDHISYLIDQEKDIKICINSLRFDESTEHTRRKEVDTKFKERLKEIQLKCSHFEYTYHEDPAGGYDDYHSCDLCGYRW